MNKLDYTYVNEQAISTSLICPICLDVLQEPHTHITCDSAFCRSCLLKLADPICPICRWHWNELVHIDYNMYLPKANRLIRNMLDELQVECTHCKTIRRRGQFEHDCQPMTISLPEKVNDWENVQMLFSMLMIFICISLLYSYRHVVFERTLDQHHRTLVYGNGIDIDSYLFEKIYYLIVKVIEYSVAVFLFNLFLWFSILFYGDRLTSRTTNQFLRQVLEVSIIVNLITYSIYY
ncbi:unnamed protein product [Adineta ricciae]|uniref:RING-type domain-containing protein n=1 Tax=Adineta ricciae TaxID=249248 RepID=A0A813ZXU1_ADIRI|nr:unnamed protein product [Adineta ricciae]CAF1091198.1 unnamed protein product [Adineta ricciae]